MPTITPTGIDWTIPDEAYAAAARLHYAILDVDCDVPCATHPDDLWFSANARRRAEAAERCLDCPVLALCARYADLADERIGVWGGRDRTTGGHQRRRGVAPTTGRVADVREVAL